jgi:4-amino-4-deoxy-L-arabinose transferase-like glycosyltransferase
MLLAVLASAMAFVRLGEGSLYGDEAAFACTTLRMRASGDWVVPYLGGAPHLNATPLYNWLTLASAAWFDESPLPHRFCSALFGVGCVLLTFTLGTLLFSLEVGFLAGLLLTFNRDFFFFHGVRYGGMDALTTFWLTAAVVCYARLQGSASGARVLWAVLGVCIGLAWLSKPPVFGSFFLAVIGLHHLLVRRHEPLGTRVRGPLLALAAGLAVAAPWYALLWVRLGNAALVQLFVFNSVGRALDPLMRDWLCCHKALWHASNSFKLAELALATALGCWLLGRRRPQWGLVLLLTGSFLGGLTAAGKALQYIYYAFPLVCVVLVGVVLDGGPWLAARCWSSSRALRRGALVGLCLAVVAVGADAVRTVRTLAGPVWVYAPLQVYDRLAPQLAQGSCRFILFDFRGADRTTPPGRTRTHFEELYYGPSMPFANWVETATELRRLLADGKPAVVMLRPLDPITADPGEPGDLCPEQRPTLGIAKAGAYRVLTFQRTPAELNLSDLITPRPARPCSRGFAGRE